MYVINLLQIDCFLKVCEEYFKTLVSLFSIYFTDFMIVIGIYVIFILEFLSISFPVVQALQNEFELIRRKIIESLAKIMFGDSLAAEYVLLNAISRV